MKIDKFVYGTEQKKWCGIGTDPRSAFINHKKLKPSFSQGGRFLTRW